MSGKTKQMSQIKQLLRLHQQGKAKKFIARSLQVSKNTVKSYLDKLANIQIDIPSLLEMEDPVLEAQFHSGNPAYKDERYEQFKQRVDYYIKELSRTGVNKQLLWEEYRQDYPNGYGHSQFCYHLSQQQVASKPSMVLFHKAGEKLFIDFAGKKLSYIDPTTGEIIYCQVFVACLPYSDYSFAIAVRTQNIEDFLYALNRCLYNLGGVPQMLVPDNLKAAIIKADLYDPTVNQALNDFANHYNTTIVPARVRKPKDKALVENQVKLIYTRVYAKLRNQQFFDLQSLNIAIEEKILIHNQTRMQRKNYCREERFLSDEKHLLQALPEQAFELKYYRVHKVAKNNHVYMAKDKHYYSVPYVYIGTKVKMIYTRTMVYIYSKNNRIATHIRSYHTGGYSTMRGHLCSAHQHYIDRSPEYYIQKAKGKSKELHELLELLFKQNRLPEQLYKSCDGLFSLHRKTNTQTFNKACQMAIDNKTYTYRFISNILKNKMTNQEESNQSKHLPDHNNLRGSKYFT
jgi:transposase